MSHWNEKDEMCRHSALRFLCVILGLKISTRCPQGPKGDLSSTYLHRASSCKPSIFLFIPTGSAFPTLYFLAAGRLFSNCWRHVRKAGPWLVGQAEKVSRKHLQNTGRKSNYYFFDHKEISFMLFKPGWAKADWMLTDVGNMSNAPTLKEQPIIDLFSWFN